MKYIFSYIFSLLLSYTAEASTTPHIQLEAVRGSDKPIGNYAPITKPELSLSGSRGETINFQLKIKTDTCFKLSALQLPPKTEIQFYEMPYIQTHDASYPGAYVGSQHDPLIPISINDFICPLLNAKKEVTWKWLWGELKIAQSQESGTLKGKIIANIDGSEQTSVPLNLRVFKMHMPDEPSIKLYSEYTTWYGVLGHFGKTNHQESELAILYANEMRAHRISPIKFWITVPDTSEKMIDFEKLSIRSRPLWEWVDFPKPLKDDLKSQEKYWKSVQDKIVSNKIKDRALTFLFDEPEKKDFPKIVALSRNIHRWAPDLKIMITSSAPELDSTTDIMVPVMNNWGNHEQELVKSHKKQLWSYLSCMSHGCGSATDSGLPDWVLDRPSTWIRSMSWIAHRLNLKTLLYYSVNYAFQFYPKKDPWKDLWYFTGNGDGTLFYPGRTEGEPHFIKSMPVDSIRLKIWRESSFDAEYLHWMEQSKSKPKNWKEKYDALVRDQRNWSKNYDQYQALRDEAGIFLDDSKETTP